MTRTTRRDNTPPHYAADAGDGCLDETLHAVVRTDRSPLLQVSLPVRHFQRPRGQPAADDDRRPGADACLPEARLLSLLEELPSLATFYQTAISSTTSSSASGSSAPEARLDWLRDIAWLLQHGDPTGIARELRMDLDTLMTLFERLTGDPEWRRR